jgi:hypothetical protein
MRLIVREEIARAMEPVLNRMDTRLEQLNRQMKSRWKDVASTHENK